jgi:hypothetical protein
MDFQLIIQEAGPTIFSDRHYPKSLESSGLISSTGGLEGGNFVLSSTFLAFEEARK